MSSTTEPKRPGTEIDEETKRILDEHVDAAEKEPGRVSRQQLLEEGLRKLKTATPH
jgi:hypothetical protein